MGVIEIGVIGMNRRHIGLDALDHTLPAAGFREAKNGDENRAKPDQHELQYLVKNRREQSPQDDIEADRDGGKDDAETDVPSEHDLHDLGHGIHIDATHEHGHEGEGYRRERAGSGTITQQEVAGDRVSFTDVIKGHHDQTQKEHGGDGADPVPVCGHNAVLVGVSRPTKQLERAEVRGDKRETGDPCGHFPPRQKEFFACVGEMLQVKADAEDKDEINADHQKVNGAESNNRATIRLDIGNIGDEIGFCVHENQFLCRLRMICGLFKRPCGRPGY